MKRRLHYSPEALHDLDEIWDYIVDDCCNPDTAKDMITRIMDTLDRLRDFAEMGAPLSSATTIESDYRFMVCGSYMAFYRVEGNDAHIDRILHGKRDYMRLLFVSCFKEAPPEQ